MPKKFTLEYVKETFLKNGFELLEKKYVNSETPLTYKCSQGHINKISLGNLKSGGGCPDCSGNKKKTIGFLREELKKEGHVLLSTEYVNNKTKLDYVCANGHNATTCWSDYNQGYRCIECSGKKKKTISEINDFFESKGYKLLTRKYKNKDSPLKYTCPNGHKGVTTWHNFSSSGNRCPVCSGKKKKTYEEVKDFFEGEGYKLLSKEYVNSHSYLKYECSQGHRHKIKGYHFYHGGRCPTCFATSQSSRAEKELCNIIKKCFSDLEVLSNTRKVIPPKELDIYIPEKKLAIEYCGLYWHSKACNVHKSYHHNKMKRCSEKGIRLITIFEDEFQKDKDKILNVLFKIITNPNTPIFTRIGNTIVSDLRYDWYGSKEYYYNMGYDLSGEIGPLSCSIQGNKRTSDFLSGENKIYDCGRVIYRK